ELKTLPVFDDFELEWDLLGEEWSLLPISNEGLSYSPFDPYFALTGDDATDSGNIENLEPSIDPGLLNINTIATEKTQSQVLQEERGGKKTETEKAPKATPIKGEFAPMATPNKGEEFVQSTSTITAPMATPNRGNDFLKTFRKKSPRKYAALERSCRTPKYQQDRPLLKEELWALQQMIECMKKDLEQSIILENFITDYINKNCNVRVEFQTLCEIPDHVH
ncbi:uncharacterized protein LOC134274537, partial [Saccostrea cucullata]|uniref:uncharacterized protein LOC134274537 n=1 Tax=Saccostrea cuccullata TaxID=36930 RepID=UPI002ECFD8D2